MKSFTSVILAAGLAAVAKASVYYGNDTVVYTTYTTDFFTTVCPSATQFTYGSQVYTATASETITITDCPCTLSKPVTSAPAGTSPAASVGTAPALVWTTTVVSSYVTVCPSPTTFTQGTSTYTVTAPTTITITECPCTISYSATPVTVKTATTSYITTVCPPTIIVTGGSTYSQSTTGALTIPVIVTTPVVAASTAPITLGPSPTTTAPAVVATSASGAVSGAAGTTPSPSQYTGAANKLNAGFALVAGGVAAALL